MQLPVQVGQVGKCVKIVVSLFVFASYDYLDENSVIIVSFVHAVWQ